MSRRVRSLVLVLVAVLGAALSGCTGSAGSGGPPAQGTVTVLAASSLREAFTRIGSAFERAHPGATVSFGFGPSPGLAASIVAGAPADVFASASTASMEQVTRAGLARDATLFASNEVAVVTPPDDPGHVATLPDLARPGVSVALCQARVPCGAVAARVLANAGVRLTPVTEEADVKAVLTKVVLGEVDAGLVYVTDARAAGSKVRTVPVPDGVNSSTSYPVVVLDRAENRSLAQQFVDYVLSPAGRAVLRDAGFARP